jgi:thiol:disulfide interchange protein
MMAPRRNWLPTLAIVCALLIGCVVAWRSYVRHHPRANDAAATGAAPGRAEIYPDGRQAEADIATALARAGKENKRVLLDFGGNWCGDCQVLEMYFHDATNRPLLDSHYILVPVNIGRYDENLGIAARYGVPVDKGVPALAVLAPDGQLVYSQRHGEFEAIRTMDSASVTAFLQQWKG